MKYDIDKHGFNFTTVLLKDNQDPKEGRQKSEEIQNPRVTKQSK